MGQQRLINQYRLHQEEYHNLFKEFTKSEDRRMFFKYIQFSFRVGQSTVRNIIKEVCTIVFDILSPLYLKASIEENCYYNYKKYFSIVLMTICDHVYRFKLVDIGAYGENTTSNEQTQKINKSCSFGINHSHSRACYPFRALIPTELSSDSVRENRPLHSNISIPGFSIGDAAFPLTTKIMKPYCGSNLTIVQKIFNYRQFRARRIIENSFCILTNRWQVFHKSFCMLPKTADKITLTCVTHKRQPFNEILCEYFVSLIRELDF
ncbi:hypothetical protein ACFW04_013627 [Cataglyphis niger]